MKFVLGTAFGVLLSIAFGLGFLYWFSKPEILTYPDEVLKPTEIEELQSLLLPFEGYTIFRRDQEVAFLDLDKTQELGVSMYEFWVFRAINGQMKLEKRESGRIDTKLGGTKHLEIFDGYEIDFIDRHMIRWDEDQSFFYSESLPESFLNDGSSNK